MLDGGPMPELKSRDDRAVVHILYHAKPIVSRRFGEMMRTRFPPAESVGQ